MKKITNAMLRRYDEKKRMTELGISWKPIESPNNIKVMGFVQQDNFLGAVRTYYNNVLYCSTSFVLAFCEPVTRHKPTKMLTEMYGDGVEIKVMKIPDDIWELAKPFAAGFGGDYSQHLMLPVHPTDPFPSSDCTPCFVGSGPT